MVEVRRVADDPRFQVQRYEVTGSWSRTVFVSQFEYDAFADAGRAVASRSIAADKAFTPIRTTGTEVEVADITVDRSTRPRYWHLFGDGRGDHLVLVGPTSLPSTEIAFQTEFDGTPELYRLWTWDHSPTSAELDQAVAHHG